MHWNYTHKQSFPSHTAFIASRRSIWCQGGGFFIRLSVCVCLFVCLFILFVCLFVCLSVYLLLLNNNGFQRSLFYLTSLQSGEHPRQLYFSNWQPCWKPFSKWPTVEKQITGTGFGQNLLHIISS